MTRVALVLVLLAALAAGAAAPAVTQASSPPIVRPADEAIPLRELGRQLFAANCARCHGSQGRGITAAERGVPLGRGPSLLGVGPLATDFYLRTGYMPLGEPTEQPERSRVRLSDREIRALVDYVDSLSEAPGPPVPRPDPAAGSLSDGLRLFTEHCAGCHQVVAEGGVVTGARVPPLDRATPVQIAQAVRIGPYVMPRFSKSDISDPELNSIIRYVRYAQAPEDAGGWGIGHLGPFPEGIVTGAVAAILLVAVCVVIGERARRA